ncbi:PKD domain-containing protein [Candidatus Acetothermia bacterium]|nr:PKD domain-containing protein [Candidatus Acetothermia bacterium]
MSEIAKITGGQFFEKFNDTVPRAIFRSFERTILARSLRVVETLPAELNYESSSEHSPARVTQNANKTTTLEWTIDELRFGEEWKTVFKVTGNKEGAFLINARPSKLSYADFRGKKIDRDLPNTSLKVLSMPRPPIAGFDFTPSNPSANDEVSFIDQSSAPGGAVASWLWDFGDGTTSNQASPTHKYAQDGVYTVTLTVTDADGLTNTKTRTVKVETLRVTVKREINTYLPNDETLPQQTFSVTLNIQVNQKLLGMGIEEILPDKWTVIEKDGNTARFRAEGTKQQWLFSEELTAGTVKTITYDVKLNQGANSGKIVGKVSSAFPAFETMITGENSVKIATQLPFRVLLSRWDPSKQVGNNDPEDEPAPLNIRMGDKLTQEQVLAAVGWWQGNPALPGYFSKRAKEKLSLQVMQELIAYWLTDTSVLESLPPIK